ncbi:hypothetical protein GETHOR_22830 [Geothrix oryzae]|uniref:Cohesin domain-containing protein n=1 Tax=Geothrix oryzae TaxID=2927975 RepID=A0ABM8DT41_9BACT|nr:hypothetical protein [Geothrix oryzae]BDU70182.1 hypothetical protein GETHOR_22830 [Geothrix oryzae]
MPNPLRTKNLLGSSLVASLVIPLLACLGGGGGSASAQRSGPVPLQMSVASLSIPAGGGGFVAVTATRPLAHYLNYQGPLTLSLDHPPAGVRGSGSIPADQSTGTLSLWVDPSVAPRTIQGLQVLATGGSTVSVATFDLTIAPPLPPGRIRSDLVQASGRVQQAGTLTNAPLVQEPVAATTATDAAKVDAVRHGFDPSTQAP